MYTGHGINTLREGLLLGTYFYTYEGIREWLQNQTDGSNSSYNNSSSVLRHFAIPVAGGIAGAWAWFVSFPLDCIKAGIQGQSTLIQYNSSSVEKNRLGAVGVLKRLWKTKGIGGLYAGVTPSIARAFLVSASRFSAYEFALWLLRDSFILNG